MKEYIKNIFKGRFFTTVVYLVLGIWLVMFPIPAVDMMCKAIFGIVMMLVGLYHIWLYLSEAGEASIFNLFTGVIMLVLGVFFFQNPNIVEQILPSLLAALLLVDSISTLRTGLKRKQHERVEWKFFIVVGLLFVTLGIVLFMNPFTTIEKTILFAGWSFISDAGLAVVSIILSMIGNHAIKKEKNKIEIKAEEENFEINNEVKAEEENFEISNEVKAEDKKDSFRSLLQLDEDALEEWKD